MATITEIPRPLLEVEDLNFWYGSTQILKSASFTLGRGGITAIVGESGSGKSTLINAILGLQGNHKRRIEARSLRFDGTDLRTLSHRDWRKLRGKRIGYVAQDAMGSLNPLRRLGVQLAEALMLYHGMSRRDAGAEALRRLASLGFEDPQRVHDSYPHLLSGGMNQRVAIAIALSGDPQIVLADEPTSALDVSVQRQVLDHLTDAIRDRGVSLLLITHDLALAADRADRVLVMQHGQIVEDGPTARVLRAPHHPYTRALIAAAPMLSNDRKASPVLPPSDALLSVRGLTKTFRGARDVLAFDDISFDLRAGQTVCIVGESGSGKTSLVRALLQLAPVDGGRIDFDGRSIGGLEGAALKRFRREAQMVYQNPYTSLNLRHRVSALLQEPLRIHGIGTAAERAEAARQGIARVGLPADVLHKRPSQLSGGQRQRVAIARALVMQPKLLVLDEAVSALDVSAQQAVLDLLKSLQASLGLAYLFITHDLAVAKQVSDHVLVMSRGRIVEQGETARVFAAPQHPYTRNLLQSAPGALVNGALAQADPSLVTTQA